MIGVVAAVFLGATWPVEGETILKHVSPTEVARIPQQFVHADRLPAKPDTRRWSEVSTLEGGAGFGLLMPVWLPANCGPRERFLAKEPRVVYLTYSCLILSEQLAQQVQTPQVGPNSISYVTVGPYDALMVNGGWVTRAGSTEPP